MLPGKRVFVTGSVDGLGPQEESKALALNPVGGCIWSGDVTVPSTSFPFTYRCRSNSQLAVLLLFLAPSHGPSHGLLYHYSNRDLIRCVHNERDSINRLTAHVYTGTLSQMTSMIQRQSAL